MVGKSQPIANPIRGLGKLMLVVSAKAWTLTVAVAADTRGTLKIIGSRVSPEEDDREMAGAGPDDMPMEREKRDNPFRLGA